VTWDDILWAAVTIGRPNRQYVFRYGDSSIFEAIFRWSLVRMALEQSGPGGFRIRRTNAVKTLDPTEKGAVNYFLGMTFCKLFAAKLLNTPWLLHLDVFRSRLNPVLIGRSRPDLVGMEHGTTQWHAFECKGRVSPPDSSVMTKAKAQAQRLRSVNSTQCSLHVGTITHFRGDVLHFYWRDPLSEKGDKIDVHFIPNAWQYYYLPVFDLIRSNPDFFKQMQEKPVLMRVKDADLMIGICPGVLRALVKSNWEEARFFSRKDTVQIEKIPYQADGIAVVAGDSWFKPFEEADMYRG